MPSDREAWIEKARRQNAEGMAALPQDIVDAARRSGTAATLADPMLAPTSRGLHGVARTLLEHGMSDEASIVAEAVLSLGRLRRGDPASRWEYGMLHGKAGTDVAEWLEEAGLAGWEAWHIDTRGRHPTVHVKRRLPFEVLQAPEEAL